jgi:type II secretory ATPase GspE/PulE/Tfp pilus assembly ATPase PilB-like protein
VLAQRLVRRLCSECRTSRPASADEVDELLADYMHGFGEGDTPATREATRQEWLQRFGRDGRLHLHHAPGCDHCGGTGFRGRAGVHELMVVSRAIRRLIQTGARAEALQETALREGMRTLRQDGIEKVWAGVTTIDEVRAISNS